MSRESSLESWKKVASFQLDVKLLSVDAVRDCLDRCEFILFVHDLLSRFVPAVVHFDVGTPAASSFHVTYLCRIRRR